MRMADAVKVAKPTALARRSYSPAARAEKWKEPSRVESCLVLKPVSWLATVTAAADTTPPDASLISPSSTPTGSCACAHQPSEINSKKDIFPECIVGLILWVGARLNNN